MSDIAYSYDSFVSTEKCIETAGMNKYEVSVLVAKRSRELASGLASVVPVSDRKHVNAALAEFVSGALDLEALNARLIKGLKNVESRDVARFRTSRYGDRVAAGATAEPEDELASLRNSIMAAVSAHKADTTSGVSGDIDGGVGTISYAEENIEESDDD